MKKVLFPILALVLALGLSLPMAAGASPGPGIVGLWHLDEGSGAVAYDSSGNANDGTIYGATWTTEGMFGNALSFDGDDYVELPASNSILDTDIFTVEAWFKTSLNHPAYGVGGKEGRLVNLHRMGTASTAVSLYVEENKIGLLYYTGAGHVWVKYTVDYHDGEWHHIAVTHDASTYRLYYDGAEVASQDDAFGDFGTYPAYLGTYNSLERFFNGTIDEVRIWDEALTGTQIAQSASLGDLEFAKELVSAVNATGDPVDTEAIPLGERITFTMEIEVDNTLTGLTLNDVTVKDRLGAELELDDGVDDLDPSTGTASFYLSNGKSKKVFIDWDVGTTLGAVAETLGIEANTDHNPGGGKKAPHQEYTETGDYELNSGATLTFYVTIAEQDIYLVLVTDPIPVTVVGTEED